MAQLYDHQDNIGPGSVPLLVIDAWEHAYFFDYQTKKGDYVANILGGLNWDVLNKRIAQLGGAAAV